MKKALQFVASPQASRVRSRINSLLPAITLAGVVLSGCSVLQAGQLTWLGATDQSFSSAGQWSPSATPQPSDTLTINSGRAITSSQENVTVRDGGSIHLTGSSTGLGKVQNPSSWEAPRMQIGVSGIGSVLVENGATLVTMGADVGGVAGSVGTVTVQGVGSTWVNGVTHFYVGTFDTGTATVNFLNNAYFDYFSEVIIGNGSRAATMTFDHSTFKAATFIVGGDGDATLNLRNGASGNVLSTSISAFGGQHGTVNVDGIGTVLNNGSSTGGLGGVSIGGVSEAAMNVTNGGKVVNTGGTSVSRGTGHGVLTVSGAGSLISNGTSFRAGSSTGGGAETFLSSGARITAGTVGLLEATSDLSFTASQDDDAGRLAVLGTVTLGGDLFFRLAPGYVPVGGTTFVLITASSFTGQFANFTSDIQADLIYDAKSVSVRIVPEPATLTLTAGSMMLLLRRRRGE